MNLARLRLVTFDVTDTLLAFREPPGKKYAQIAANYKIQCDETALLKNFKHSWIHMNKDHPNFGRHSGLGWECWWKNIIIGTFQDAKFPNNKDVALEALCSQLIEAYKSFKCWKYCTGVLDLLSYLRHKKVLLGVISNFDPRLHETLRSAKMEHYFKFILTSYEAGVLKPDPRIFSEAVKLAEVQGLDTKECLHVGNTIDTDYEGAIDSGWQSALIYNGNIDKLHDSVNTQNVFDSLFSLQKQFVSSYKDSLLVHSNGNRSI